MTVHKLKLPTADEMADMQCQRANAFMGLEKDIFEVRLVSIAAREAFHSAGSANPEMPMAAEVSSYLLERLFGMIEALHAKYYETA